MKHLGDITKISGYDVPLVDCIIGGSPCQDLSVAGKRAGLAGQRSGLFMEQMRIVKEMRDADRKRGRTGQLIRPRYMVWENVPGAFSSNHGEDFRAVLEETIRIADPDAPDVPLPPKGKWPLADAYTGDGWSVAYRVLDAQFWGVPQRRRRIALVADFGGQSAPEILFERKGLHGYPSQSGEAGQGTSPGTESGAYPTVARSLTARYDGSPCIDRGPNIIVQDRVNCLTPWDTQSARVYGENGAWHSLNANENGGQSRDAVLAFTQNQRNEVRDLHDVAGSLAAEPGMKQQTFVCAGFKAGNGPKANGIGYEPEKAPTLSAANSGTNQVPAVISFNTMVCTRDGEHEKRTTVGISEPDEPMFTLSAAHSHAVFCLQGNCIDRSDTAGGNGNGETVPTITGDHENRVTDYTSLVLPFDTTQITSKQNGSHPHYGDPCHPLAAGAHPPAIVAHTLRGNGNDPHREDAMTYPVTNGSVRRLTPLECERLQGFPDGWTDIGDWVDENGKVRKTSDAARYKALGNSIALPPWKWVLKRLCANYERDATMASLFDGIGGFPLIWERLNGPGTCLWASEVEPFCIAVTKTRFKER